MKRLLVWSAAFGLFWMIAGLTFLRAQDQIIPKVGTNGSGEKDMQSAPSFATPEKPKPVALTPADREPAHLALEKLTTAQAQFFQLQLSIPELQKAYEAEIAKLKAQCGTELVNDSKGVLQCSPQRPTEPPAR
jgi:hypothetical protein